MRKQYNKVSHHDLFKISRGRLLSGLWLMVRAVRPKECGCVPSACYDPLGRRKRLQFHPIQLTAPDLPRIQFPTSLSRPSLHRRFVDQMTIGYSNCADKTKTWQRASQLLVFRSAGELFSDTSESS